MASTEDPSTPEPEADDPHALISWAVFLVVAVIVVGWIFIAALDVLVLIYLGGLFAVGLAPLVGELERRPILLGRRPSRGTAASIVFIVAGTALGGLLLAVVPTIATQAREFAAFAPHAVTQVQEWLMQRGLLHHALTMQDVLQSAPGGSDAVGVLFGTIFGMVGGLTGVVTIFILSFYFLVESQVIFLSFVRLFPRPRRLRVRQVAGEITDKVSAWLTGQLFLCGLIGVSTACVLAILGVPYFWVLAILAAAGELLPYVGPVLAAVPALAAASAVSWQLVAATAAFYVLQQQVENHVVIPRVMRSQLGLSSATVIIALMMGGTLLGMMGIILAVPTAAILQVLAQELIPGIDDRT